jgi:hypothetical protein
MALPTFIGIGSEATGAGAVSPSIHASTQAGDLIILVCETNGDTVANPDSSVWTPCPGSPVSATAALPTRVTAFWRVAVASTPAPSVSGTNHIVAVCHTFRGVDTANPFNTSATHVAVSGVNSWRAPGVTTTVNDCLIFGMSASGRDQGSTTWFGAPTNASLANLTMRVNRGISTGDGGALGTVTGEKATAGVVSDTTGSLANNTTSPAGLTLALQPPSGQNFDRFISDTVTTTESAGRVLGAKRSPADTVATTESAGRIVGAARPIADTVTTSDAVDELVALRRILDDTTLLSEQINTLFGRVRAIVDTVVTDEVLAASGAYGRPISDDTSVTDDLGLMLDAVRRLADDLSSSDVVGMKLDAVRAIDEIVSVTDDLERSVGMTQGLEDTTVVSEDIGLAFGVARRVSDSVVTSEGVGATLDAIRRVVEDLALSEELARSVETVRLLEETTVTSDEVATGFAIIRQLDDSVLVSEQVGSHQALARQLVDEIFTSDEIAFLLQLPQISRPPIVSEITTGETSSSGGEGGGTAVIVYPTGAMGTLYSGEIRSDVVSEA